MRDMQKHNLFYITIGVLTVLLVLYILFATGVLPVPPAMQFFLAITFAALLDSVNPCAFSILFLTIAFLFSMGRSRKEIVITGLLYIAGIAVCYVLIGLGILKVLSIFNLPHGMARIGAAILIAFGVISVINEYFPSFPIKLKIPHVAHNKIALVMQKATLPSAFLLGVLVGLFEFPCTGGPYLLVLGMLHDSSSFWGGFAYLAWYNFVFVAPLIVALALSVNKNVAEKIDYLRRQETKKARLSLALIMIVLGFAIFYF